MRILHISEKLRFSGAELLIKDLTIRHSRNNLVAVGAFAPTEKSFLNLEKEMQESGVKLFIPFKTLSRFERLKFLIKTFKEFSPDIVVGHSAVVNAYLRIAGSLFPKMKKVIVLHSGSGDYEKERRLRYLEYMLQRFTDCVVGVSDWSSNIYRARFKKPYVVTIYNGVDVKKFQNPIRKKKRDFIRRRIFNAKSEDFVIIQIGRIANEKNQLLTLKAINQLYTIKKRLKLIFAGPIEDNEYFYRVSSFIKKNNLHENVVILKSRTDIPDLLKSADLYVMPSIRENFSMALLEALASGIPIICSDINQFIFLDKYGFPNLWKFDLNNLSFYSKLIEYVFLKKPSFVQRNLDDFNIENTSNKYLLLFKELLDGS